LPADTDRPSQETPTIGRRPARAVPAEGPLKGAGHRPVQQRALLRDGPLGLPGGAGRSSPRPGAASPRTPANSDAAKIMRLRFFERS